MTTRQRGGIGTRPWRSKNAKKGSGPDHWSAATDSHGEQAPGDAREPRKRGAWKRQEGRKPATANDPCEGKPLKAPQDPMGVTGEIRRVT